MEAVTIEGKPGRRILDLLTNNAAYQYRAQTLYFTNGGSIHGGEYLIPGEVIGGTGHRPEVLGGYDQATYEKVVLMAMGYLSGRKKNSVVSLVVSGMALGWDMALMEAAQVLDIPTLAAIPFEGYELNWFKESQNKYYELLRSAMAVVYVSGPGYAPSKNHIRNHWMVKASDYMLAVYNGQPYGGTAECVKYANKKGRVVVNLWDSWESRYKNGIVSMS